MEGEDQLGLGHGNQFQVQHELMTPQGSIESRVPADNQGRAAEDGRTLDVVAGKEFRVVVDGTVPVPVLKGKIRGFGPEESPQDHQRHEKENDPAEPSSSSDPGRGVGDQAFQGVVAGGLGFSPRHSGPA